VENTQQRLANAHLILTNWKNYKKTKFVLNPNVVTAAILNISVIFGAVGAFYGFQTVGKQAIYSISNFVSIEQFEEATRKDDALDKQLDILKEKDNYVSDPQYSILKTEILINSNVISRYQELVTMILLV
jgi:hypothetical protein